jgi:PAS domain S-box-containing protein
MNDSAKILIVDDEERVRLLLQALIEKDGYECHTASNGVEALSALRENDFSVVVADLLMPELDGIGLLAAIKEAGMETVAIILTGYGDLSSAVEAMKLGAYDFLSKPITDGAAFRRVIARAVEHARVLRHHRVLERVAAEWESTFDASPDLIAVLDKEGRIIRYNQALAERLGLGKSDGGRRSCQEILGRAMCAAEDCLCARTLSDGATHLLEVHSDMLEGDFLVTTSPLRNGNGQVWGAVCIARDITSLKQSAKTLDEARRQTRLIIDTAPDAFVAMDASGLIVDWNHQAEGTFGWRRAEVIGRPLAEVIIPPRYRAAHREGLRRFLATGEGKVINQRLEVWALHRDGHEFPVELTVSHPLQQGQRCVFHAFLHDITGRKRAEQQLRLQAAAMEAAANAIVITDREGKIQWVNPAFTHMTGYSAEEALGATPRLLKSGAHAPSFYQQLWQTVLAGEVWRGEMVNRRKDGSLYIEEQTITPVRDERGEISAFLSIKQDVTERKQLEQALRQAHAENERLLLAISSVLIRVNRDDLVTHWNHVAEEIFNLRAADAVGRPFYELPIPWDWNVVRPCPTRTLTIDH